MKKKKVVSFILMTIFCIPFLTGCQDLSLKEDTKTSYRISEEAKLDHFQITLSDVEFKDEHLHLTATEGTKIMILTFKVKNNANNTMSISGNSFDLFIDNEEYYPVASENVSINSNKEIQYEIIYEVPIKDQYSILFYSGVVTNNVSFEITH